MIEELGGLDRGLNQDDCFNQKYSASAFTDTCASDALITKSARTPKGIMVNQ